MSKNVLSEIGFGVNDDAIGNSYEKFKIKKDRPELISMALWPGIENLDEEFNVEVLETEPTPRFLHARTSFVKGAGTVILSEDPIVKSLVKSHGDGKIRDRFGTVIIQWPTIYTESTALLEFDPAAFRRGEYKVWPLIFGKDKYKQLKSIGSVWKLGKHDLVLTLAESKEEHYQDFSAANQPSSFLNVIFTNAKKKDKFVEMQANLRAKIKDVVENMVEIIGNFYTGEELQRKLADGGGAPSASSGSNVAAVAPDLEKLLDM